MKKKEQLPLIFITCLFMGGGALLSLMHTIVHGPEYIAAYFTKVKHPIQADYSEYNALLKDIVRGDRVDYAAAKNNPHMEKALKVLAETSYDEFPNDAEKLTYLINAYNLLVVKTIADRFPVSNYNAVTNDMSSRRFTVGGVATTVKDLRQLKIQPLLLGTNKGDYSDCRMIMLIAGGAVGFPPLPDHALTVPLLKKDMEDNTEKFLVQKRNFYFDKSTTTILVSPLFQWYTSLFQMSYDEPFDFAMYYNRNKKHIDSTDYHLKRNYNTYFDWRINDIAAKD